MKKFILVLLFPICGFSQLSSNGLILKLLFSNNSLDNSSNNISTNSTVSSYGVDRFGNNQNAALFNGTNSSVTINNNMPVITTSDFVVAGWVKMSGQGGGMENQNVLFQQRDDNATLTAKSTILLVTKTASNLATFVVRSGINTNAASVSVTVPSPSMNQWHHYLGMKCGNEVSFYIDGVLAGTSNYNQTGDFITSIDYVSVGVHTHTLGSVRGLMNGYIDDVFIFNRCLTSDEIKDLYSNTFLTIDENEKSFGTLKIFPNPIENESINIDLTNKNNIQKIKIIDVSGQLIFELDNCQSKNIVIPFEYKSGIYLIQGLDRENNIIEVSKVVKK